MPCLMQKLLLQLTCRIFIKISDTGDSDKCECILRLHRIHNDSICMQGGREFDTPNMYRVMNLWTNLVSFVTKKVNLIESIKVS